MSPRSEESPFVWERHTFAGKRWPRNRVVRSFLLVVPWLNLLALGVLLWMVGQATLVQPGRTMTLAKSALTEGLPGRGGALFGRPPGGADEVGRGAQPDLGADGEPVAQPAD